MQFEMGLFRLSVSRLVYFSQNFEEKYWSSIRPLAPATFLELFSI